MTTTYYTVQTRKVKISGGGEYLSPISVTRREDGAPGTPRGEGQKAQIIELEPYRRRMEAIRKGRVSSFAELAEDEMYEVSEKPDGLERVVELLRSATLNERMELLASVAVIVAALSAAAAFLSVL